jgi:hypothetical protein
MPAPVEEYEPVIQTLPDNVQVPIGDSGYDVGIAIGPDEVTISAEPNEDYREPRTTPRTRQPEPLPGEEDDGPAPRDIPTIAPPPPTFEEEGEEPPPDEE